MRVRMCWWIHCFERCNVHIFSDVGVIKLTSSTRPSVDDMYCVLVCLQQWYTSTMNLLGTWLTDRMDLQLHLYQLKILIRIVKVRTAAFHISKPLISCKLRDSFITLVHYNISLLLPTWFDIYYCKNGFVSSVHAQCGVFVSYTFLSLAFLVEWRLLTVSGSDSTKQFIAIFPIYSKNHLHRYSQFDKLKTWMCQQLK